MSWLLVMPGWVVSLLTFPGIIVHEFAHRLCCDVLKVPVYEAHYFKPGEDPAGYIRHQPAETLFGAMLIALGPLIVNTLLCALISFPAVFSFLRLDRTGEIEPLQFLLLWISLSIGMHAFPSPEDAQGVADALSSGNRPNPRPGRLVMGVARFIHWSKALWVDVMYAVGVSLILPTLVLWALAAQLQG